MHYLQRGAAPLCLAHYRHGENQWSDLSPQEKAEIWQQLQAMQGQRCAYCECDISNGDKHIEHFRQRSRHPQGTFDWENLFGSCNRQNSCGKHKDSCGHYPPLNLIKPDEEDPEHFFQFSSNGTIAVRPDLAPTERKRAEESLRVFNLDAEHGPLRAMRHAHLQGYVQQAEFLAELSEVIPEDDWRATVEQELAAIAHLPFATAIKHTLLP